jgi:chromosome partitioning protein
MSDASEHKTELPCDVCGTSFKPRHSFQEEIRDGRVRRYCSLPCRAASSPSACAVCAGEVRVRYAYQVLEHQGQRIHVCSEGCYAQLKSLTTPPQPAPRARRLAVINQKGGTGKTTTSVGLAAGLVEEGRRVLLIDADPQGSVGVSLGVRSQRSLYQVLLKGMPLEEAVVPLAGNFDVLVADGTLAHVDLEIAQDPKRASLFMDHLADAPYDDLVIDCGPALSMINQSVLSFVDEVMVPCACEYLSLVGLKQLLETLKRVNLVLGHPVEVTAVVPTFYDARTRGCQDALEALKKHFGARCAPAIRTNVRLKEAPRHKKSIFEFAPDSHGAEDYRSLVRWWLKTGEDEAEAAPAPIEF